MTKDKPELTSAQEHKLAEELHRLVLNIEEELADQRATGKEKPGTLTAHRNAVEKYQAARIAADRPRQG